MSTKMSAPSAPSTPLEKTAASWLARCDAGLSEAEEVEFEGWLSADPSHAVAWQEISAVWRAFDAPRRDGVADALVRELSARQHRRQWRRSMATAAGLAAAAAAVVVLLMRPGGTYLSHPGATAIADRVGPSRVIEAEAVDGPRADSSRGLILRTSHQILEDGSMVELDRGAKIEVSFSRARRSVHLMRGEALFTVAKNSARPFIVSSGGVDVQAVGTAFAVTAGHDSIDVIVTEGRVAVGRSTPAVDTARSVPSAPTPVLVDAGRRVSVPEAAVVGEQLQVEALGADEMSRRLAWLGPRLELSATRLGDAVALFNHENRVQLRIATPALGELRLSGVFRADDAEGFARLLGANYGVTVTRHDNRIELSGK